MPEQPTPEPTPTGDMRERLAEALYRRTTEQAAGGPARLLTRDETVLWENSLARADAVMHVIEAEILTVQVDATQRADELAGRLQEAERQRDEALAAITRHAAEAHRRKWAHDGDNQAAFDVLHRLGNEILADRDRLLAVLDQPEETPPVQSTT